MSPIASIPTLIACVSAGVAGFVFSRAWVRAKAIRLRRNKAKDIAVRKSDGGGDLALESTGAIAAVIELARRKSLRACPASGAADTIIAADRFSRHFETRVLKAGLRSELTRSGYAATRLILAGAGLCMGAVLGIVFSSELSVLLGMMGLGAGWATLPAALRKESRTRSSRLESWLWA